MNEIAADWVRLGVMFNVSASAQTPDLERLLLDTVRAAGANTRLMIMAASWLTLYGDYVARRRLAILVHDELELRMRARMGLLLEWVKTHSRRQRDRFDETIALCSPLKAPEPLAEVNHRSDVLWELARKRAGALSRKWGCWMEDFEIKDDALRPAEWIGRENPVLAIRAISGDLVASIAADAEKQEAVFESESAMARYYGATRPAVRDAILKLKLAGRARQGRQGKSRPITVFAAAAN